MFDSLTSDIRCPRCGHLCRAVEETRLQTYLRKERDGSLIEPGYAFAASELEPEHILDAGYALLRLPNERGQVSLLDRWTCSSCKVEQWGSIEIADSQFARISPVELNQEALRNAHFISEVDALSLAGSLLGLSPRQVDEQQLDPVAVLRQRLPE